MTWRGGIQFFRFFLLLGISVPSSGLERRSRLQTFSFDVHHRFSDRITNIFGVGGFPDKHTVGYYRVMAHRDRFINGRRLASSAPLTFKDGNETFSDDTLGFLHYANVSVGTPAKWFLVALDTGSDLFWLPCDCSSCPRYLNTSDGAKVDLNIYSPKASSTSSEVGCNSTLCSRADECSSDLTSCPYQVRYLSDGTSSTGYLVEDVLHLISSNEKRIATNPKVTLGCGKVQTGVFHDGAAPNGLFGLGISNVSVPSALARAGIASDTFSMCFGRDGSGRISFGDRGSDEQRETPLHLRQPHPTYNITITQIIVGGSIAQLEFNAVFDSGTSFTYLSDPAYTLFCDSFSSLAVDRRYTGNADVPFEYCYEIRQDEKSFKYPAINLTMKGGGSYPVYRPLVLLSLKRADVYCLGIIKSEDISIIGQNFMTGYKVLFDREKMVLGWKESNCYETTSDSGARSSISSSPPPTPAFNPEATNIEKGSLAPCPGPTIGAILVFLVVPSYILYL